MAEPTATPAPAAAPATQGFTIEISCLPDGTFQVSSEPLQEEAQEETGAPGSEAGQTVKSFGEALKIALQLFQAGGSTGSDEFESGYAGGNQPPADEMPEETSSMAPDPSMMARG